MALIVQKFGGTSVGSIERIKYVAQLIKKQRNEGDKLVVIVSAMGQTTNSLAEMASKLSSRPQARAMDMLLSTGEQVSTALLTIALQEIGVEAVGMTGFQAGVLTTGVHGDAEILRLEGDKVTTPLREGKVVVIAGFQGVTEREEITTLGRGGSDISAVALAALLQAQRCEIFTDVSGVYSADPRIVPTAKVLCRVSYEDMLEYASLGAQVLHPKAVEWAERYQIPLLVKSSFEECEGTWIVNASEVSPVTHSLGLTYRYLDEHSASLSLIRDTSTAHQLDSLIINYLREIDIQPQGVESSQRSLTCIVAPSEISKALPYLHSSLGLADDKTRERESLFRQGKRIVVH